MDYLSSHRRKSLQLHDAKVLDRYYQGLAQQGASWAGKQTQSRPSSAFGAPALKSSRQLRRSNKLRGGTPVRGLPSFSILFLCPALAQFRRSDIFRDVLQSLQNRFYRWWLREKQVSFFSVVLLQNSQIGFG